MQPFRNHLGTEQDIDFAQPKISENISKVLFAFQRVRVHAADAGFRE
jgi:hypothetical protein